MCYQTAVGQGLSTARDYLEKARSMLEELEDVANLATVMGNLGIIYHNQGEFTKALEYSEKAAQDKRDLGDGANFALHAANAASSLLSLGRYREAMTLAEDARRAAHQDGHTVAEIWANLIVGFTACYDGQFDLAERLLVQSLEESEQKSLTQQVADARSMLGRLYYRMGRKGEAREQFKPGIETARRCGHEHAFIYCSAYLAALDPDHVVTSLRRLDHFIERTEGTFLHVSMMRLKGDLLLSSGDQHLKVEGHEALQGALEEAKRMEFAAEVHLIEDVLKTAG
jgi:tetratricopeptide (TPR) repeat protein